jgi:sugar phosphate isomerase/epimerase
MSTPSPSIPRRDFLLTALAGSAAASLAGGRTAVAEAQDAPPRMDSSFMKLSLAAYSFNRFLPNSWRGTPRPGATMTLEDFIRYCAEQNLDGTELTGYYFPEKITTEYLVSLKQLTFRYGLGISGTAIGNDFCIPDPEKLRGELDRTKLWIDYAARMGAPVIRVFAGKVHGGDTEQAAIARCAATMNTALEYAAEQGVFLALENHGGITATPAQMLSIIEQIHPSPWFGVNFDSGNFRTDDPYGDLEKIAPLAINAQVKATIAPSGRKEPADLARIVQILRDANYRGYVALEYEEPEDPKVEIPKLLDQLKQLIHA